MQQSDEEEGEEEQIDENGSLECNEQRIENPEGRDQNEDMNNGDTIDKNKEMIDDSRQIKQGTNLNGIQEGVS